RQISCPAISDGRAMLEGIPAAEQIFDEPFDPVVTVRVLLPIEHGEHCGHRDRVDTILTLEQIRVLLLGELAKRVQIFELFGERDIHQMQPRALRNLGEKIDRFGDHPGNGVDLTGLQLLQRRYSRSSRLDAAPYDTIGRIRKLSPSLSTDAISSTKRI